MGGRVFLESERLLELRGRVVLQKKKKKEKKKKKRKTIKT